MAKIKIITLTLTIEETSAGDAEHFASEIQEHCEEVHPGLLHFAIDVADDESGDFEEGM